MFIGDSQKRFILRSFLYLLKLRTTITNNNLNEKIKTTNFHRSLFKGFGSEMTYTSPLPGAYPNGARALLS